MERLAFSLGALACRIEDIVDLIMPIRRNEPILGMCIENIKYHTV
jgi:hypothetical protein